MSYQKAAQRKYNSKEAFGGSYEPREIEIRNKQF